MDDQAWLRETGLADAIVGRAAPSGRHGFRVAPDTCFGQARDRMLDLLGDLVETHLDTAALWRLIDSGPPPALPTVCARLDSGSHPLRSGS